MAGKRLRDDVEEDHDSEEYSTDEEVQEAIAAGLIKPDSAKSENVYNYAALRDAYDNIKEDLPWIERLEVVSADTVPDSLAKDDLKLELAFYGQALAAVSAARSEFERQNVPHRRPADYFAEMLKSDKHMEHVKNKLLTEQKRMTAVESRKKSQDAAKFNKLSAIEKTKQKALEKRQTLDSIKQWKKNKDSHGDASERDAALERALGDKPKGMKLGTKLTTVVKKSSKRKGKDEKYGFGGKKRNIKENTMKSSGNMKSFSSHKMKQDSFGLRKPSGQKKAKAGPRPGKWARNAKK